MSSFYISCIAAASTALSARKEEVNRLNVFPVPDGDTGTNMSLTMETVVKELDALPDDAGLAMIGKTVTHGSLMGARGNSGVITSQILRGLCEGLAGAEVFDAALIDKAMRRSVEVAFKAVRKPVEGTILTVLRDTADAATKAAKEGLSRDEALSALSTEAFASVRRTPELLPVLKENGVVDSGAFGLAILIEAFSSAVMGTDGSVPDSSTLIRAHASEGAGPKVAIEQVDDWAGSKFLYCTEFLLRSDGIDKDATIEFLGSMGDCELIVGEEPDYKVHVHTNEPGAVLTYMTDRGQVSEVFIHNMRLQSDERTAAVAADASASATTTDAGGASQAPVAPAKEIGIVAVASGVGNERILASLGVDAVVSGGQTMNPSTADLLAAAESVNAKSIVLLPDNKNIIMAANAAADVSEKPLAVVPTKSVTAAFAALFAFDPEASLDDNVAAMTEAADAVRTGEVTHAIKRAKASDGTDIDEGDIIGIANDSLDVVGSSISDVTLELISRLADEDTDTLTILAGCDLTEEDFASLTDSIAERFPDLEIDAHRGDQPVYPVIFSVE